MIYLHLLLHSLINEIKPCNLLNFSAFNFAWRLNKNINGKVKLRRVVTFPFAQMYKISLVGIFDDAVPHLACCKSRREFSARLNFILRHFRAFFARADPRWGNESHISHGACVRECEMLSKLPSASSARGGNDVCEAAPSHITRILHSWPLSFIRGVCVRLPDVITPVVNV